MNQALWEQASETFERLLALPPADRQTALNGVSSAEPAIRDLVLQLIEWQPHLDGFLTESAVLTMDDFDDHDAEVYPQALLAGRYRLVEEIGSGATGIVWRALDERLAGKPVAVKILHSHLSSVGWMRLRFEDEVRALARLHHTAIAAATDSGETPSGRTFHVLELVDGVTLRQRLQEGPIAPEEAAAIIWQIASALQAAHRANILHRDLKPENIMIEASGRVKILDFGIARVSEPGITAPTATTFIAGTVAYMSPEQLQGKVSPLNDLWALAVIAAEMTTGDRTAMPVSPRALRRFFRLALSPRPTMRFQSAEAFSRAFSEAALARDWITRRQAIAAGAPALLLGPAAWWAAREHLGWPPLADHERVIEWIGGEDPATKGFLPVYNVANVALMNPERSGRDRIRVTAEDQGGYYFETTHRQRAQAWRNGWLLSVRMLPEEGLVNSSVNMVGFGPRYDVGATAGPDGRFFVSIFHQITPEILHDEFEAKPGDDGTILVQLRFSPRTKLADLLINDTLRASGYRGHRQFQVNEQARQCGVCMAVTRYRSAQTSGVFRMIRLEILA